MNTLADAVIAALAYISTAQAHDDRLDDDVQALESLTATLHHCSAAERDALRAALQRARTGAESSANTHPDLLDTFRAIETDILDVEAT
ncbi:hypothetical protein [Verrucomicrobium sp. BvORR106]|uniref:hypothetical protein n=1 Tax=Verrucomicrobium sp. BvORR106 TaxID=1403819 RepID=UPI00056E218A|nr:hypothetical protein [Verrucomicrobium sp. BvORR106]